MKLTVMVPVYNEVRTIYEALRALERIKVPDKEVIVIDNYSTDGTRELLKKLEKEDEFKNFKFVYNEKNIVSGSFVKVMEMAKGEYIYVHHSDLEYDPQDAMKMLALAEEGGYDVVFGSRLKKVKDSKLAIIWKRPAFLASILCTALINWWYGKNFTDIIGTKLYRTASIRKVPIGSTGYAFDFEHISRICKLGLKTAEVAVSYHPRSWKEGKKIKPYHLISALFLMFKVKFFEKTKFIS